MKLAAHGFSVFHSNVMTQTTLAGALGYDCMEFLADHVLRYQETGGDLNTLRTYVARCGMTVSCLNALQGVDRWEGHRRSELLAEAERLIQIAWALGCPVIQLNPSRRLLEMPEERALEILTENIGMIAALGRSRDIRFQLEPIAHTGMDTLEKAVAVIRKIGGDRLGVVVDFWHTYASGQPASAIRTLDRALIYDVHLCDGRRPGDGEAWQESVLRSYLPGEGAVDLPAMTRAVQATGYDGVWAAELYCPRVWEWDTERILAHCKMDLLEQLRPGKPL